MKPGAWWSYRELVREPVGPIWSTTEYTTRFDLRQVGHALLLVQTGGADPGTGPVERGEGWLRLGVWTGEEALPMPLVVGATGPGAEPGLRGWTVEASEQVKVPAGTFADALRCALRTGTSESVLWIEPTIGVVRETYGRPGQPPDVERQLLRWSGSSEGPRRRLPRATTGARTVGGRH